MPALIDPATCAALTDLQLHHLALDLHVDMPRHVIAGTAILHLQRVEGHDVPPSARVLLDVFKLQIHGIECMAEGQEDEEAMATEWSIEPFTEFGDKLVIDMPEPMRQVAAFRLVIRYETLPESPAVCWLEKEQTAGKTKPYMYTQGQEVLNRSFFPCQDSPSVRVTFDAQVVVPAEYNCVMGAKLCRSEEVNDEEEPKKRFVFEMQQSIPVYLVVLAVGDIVSAPIGPRSSVWTEPSMLEACTKEFTGILDEYLRTGERLFGEYRWERYDVLVLPPAFPYGGMENPRLTFLSPSIIAGDQSLCETVAHEISHSWFGNLVTNATWSDFFLNEGFTMYAERRIVEEVHGRELMCLQAKIGEAQLRDEIRSLGEDSPLTRLRVPLETGIDPGDCYNQCAYEKGYAFVCYLRFLVGSDQAFDKFLREYSTHYRFQSIPAEIMIEYFVKSFPELSDGHGELKGPIKFHDWLHQPGYPLFTPDYSAATDMMQASEALAFHWCASDMPVQANVLYLSEEAKKWPTQQVLYFLDCCINALFQSPDVVIALGDTLALWDSTNMEVAFRWAQVLIHNTVTSRYACVERFLTTQGKQKYQIPVYRALMGSKDATTLQFAKNIFTKTESTLHVMVRDRVRALVQSAA